MAITGLVSTNLMEPLNDKLFDCGMEKLVDDAFSASWKGKDKVFVNGDWVGVCDDSLSFVTDLKHSRRSKRIPPQVLYQISDWFQEIGTLFYFVWLSDDEEFGFVVSHVAV